MINQVKAKIFLADERGLNETTWFISRQTFSHGKYFNEHKQPFAGIYVVNDEVLEAGRVLKMCMEESSYVILLPVIGAISFRDSPGNDNLIAAGQMQIVTAAKGGIIEITNPFSKGLVNFLQLCIKAENTSVAWKPDLVTYDINKRQNNLLTISPSHQGEPLLPFSISIGKFKGRGEAIYRVKNEEAGLFVFVIEGAFEVQGTLLHERDGLALWETGELELEALSNDAIILLVELSLK